MSLWDRDKALGKNRREDVSWLFSLSGSELKTDAVIGPIVF
uniref:Uncharacterized protein n=1 Tax=Nelumbo nucifera TaxID=4432 RepID=A0A822ZK61_NELNU|nr:TPA_asm: hypothetical protein HUJ06_001979 [Nelumbo nucifera]